MKKIFITFILVWCATMVNAQVKVLGKIEPNGATDTYPTHTDTLGRGGLMAVGTWQERNSIPRPRRKAGMLVRVKSATVDSTYTIGGNLTNADWTVFATGGGTPANMVTTNTDQTISGAKVFTQDVISDLDGTGLGVTSIQLHNGLGGMTIPGLIMKAGSDYQTLGFNNIANNVDVLMPSENGTLATQEWVTANTGSTITNLNQIPTRSYNDLQDKPAPVDISGKENTSNKVNSLVNPNPTTYPTTQAVAVELIAKANLDGGNVFSAGFQEIRGTNLFSGAYLNTSATTGTVSSPSIKFRGLSSGQDRYARMQTLTGSTKGLALEQSADGTAWFPATLQAGSGTFTAPNGTSTNPAITNVLDVRGGNGEAATTGTGFVFGGKGSAVSVRTGDGGNNFASNPSGTNYGGSGADITFTAGNGGTATGGATNVAGAGGSINFKAGDSGYGSVGLPKLFGSIKLETNLVGVSNDDSGGYVEILAAKGLKVGHTGKVEASDIRAASSNLKLSSANNIVEVNAPMDVDTEITTKGLVIASPLTTEGESAGTQTSVVNGTGVFFKNTSNQLTTAYLPWQIRAYSPSASTNKILSFSPATTPTGDATFNFPDTGGVVATREWVNVNTNSTNKANLTGGNTFTGSQTINSGSITVTGGNIKTPNLELPNTSSLFKSVLSGSGAAYDVYASMPTESGTLAITSDIPKIFTTTASGNGSTTEFTVPHNLGYTPTMVLVTPNSTDATIGQLNSDQVSLLTSAIISGSNIIIKTVFFAGGGTTIAPNSGTNNLTWTVMVK